MQDGVERVGVPGHPAVKVLQKGAMKLYRMCDRQVAYSGLVSQAIQLSSPAGRTFEPHTS